MSRFQITRASHVLKWVSLLCAESNFISSSSNFYVIGSHHTLQKTRFYGTRSCADLISGLGFAGKGKRAQKRARAMREQAESALAEYFHFTRNLEFMDAENMSKNAPEFFYSLMKRVDIDDDTIKDDNTISHAVRRYLMYHPVYEFEPFFESIGLKYSEYAQFLPKGLMFLADDELLLQNYYVLCNYGIQRNQIGKIFKEATEVFRHDCGALQAKLQSLENLGLKQSLVAKTVASSPHLLNGNESVGEFVDFFDKLKKLGIEHDWLLGHMREEESYNWKSMLHLMCFLCKSGWSEKQVGDLFKQNPHLLLECSGRVSFCLIGILLKFGSTMSDVQSLLLQFPHIPVSKFSYNLHNSYNFLHEIGMPALDIGRISRSYPVLLGSLELKKVSTILQKKRLCQMVKDDPFTLEGWVGGRKLEPLNTPKRRVVVRAMKTQFLISLGFEESSKEMERVLRRITGKREDLQQRFDCLLKNGLSREEVIKMVKVCPQILCLTSDLIEAKIRVFVDDFGYGVSDLVAYPNILSHRIKKLRLRLLTYKMLKDQGAVRPGLSLDYIMKVSEKDFIRNAQMVKDDPYTIDGWVCNMKPNRDVVKMAFKTQFLISLGFEQNSKDMERALRTIEGKIEHLQQRFDSLVKNGLSREEVIKMVKVCPQILCMTSDVIEAKIRVFIDDLGYGVSDLVAYPRSLCYGIKKMRLRLLTYKRLKDQGAVRSGLSLGYILSVSEKKFRRTCKIVNDEPLTLDGVGMVFKTQFLISLGFEESSKDMEKALETIQGKGQDLQQKFDCFVKNGLSREEVIKMVNVYPKILNQTTNVTEAKIRFFIDDLGYGVSDLLSHPKILCYSIKRLKLRVLMYEWLKAQGSSRPDLSLCTLLGYSDKIFIRNVVNRHARGPDFWKNLKQETDLD